MASDNTRLDQASGRFRKGQFGNPTGKPAGTRRRVTLAEEAFLEVDAEALAREIAELVVEI